jgi:dTMP kinase
LSASSSSLRGRFLSFEGIDGCGKSTQAAQVAERLERAGLPVLRTREPGGTPAGKALRQILLDPQYRGLAPDAELLLFLADRVQHLTEVIGPALARGAVVVCDRFHDATVAFQKYGRGLDFGAIQPWIDRHIQPMPHLTFWLDVDLKVATARLHRREGVDPAKASLDVLTRLEQEPSEFHARVRAGYRAIADAEPDRMVRIDGAPPIDTVQAAIWEQLTARFPL